MLCQGDWEARGKSWRGKVDERVRGGKAVQSPMSKGKAGWRGWGQGSDPGIQSHPA